MSQTSSPMLVNVLRTALYLLEHDTLVRPDLGTTLEFRRVTLKLISELQRPVGGGESLRPSLKVADRGTRI